MFIPVEGSHLTRRLIQLFAGLILFGFAIGLTLQSGLGVPPWDVMHQGMAERFGLSIGVWGVIISFVVLLLWIPLREPFGIGTLANAVVVGLMIDFTAWLVPAPDSTVVSWAFLVVGIFLCGLASGMYIGADFGPGPRDGLMTAIAKRGPSIRLTRTTIEVVVLVIGILLGGTFGVGTVLFALAVGPLVQFWLPRWETNRG